MWIRRITRNTMCFCVYHLDDASAGSPPKFTFFHQIAYFKYQYKVTIRVKRQSDFGERWINVACLVRCNNVILELHFDVTC